MGKTQPKANVASPSEIFVDCNKIKSPEDWNEICDNAIENMEEVSSSGEEEQISAPPESKKKASAGKPKPQSAEGSSKTQTFAPSSLGNSTKKRQHHATPSSVPKHRLISSCTFSSGSDNNSNMQEMEDENRSPEEDEEEEEIIDEADNGDVAQQEDSEEEHDRGSASSGSERESASSNKHQDQKLKNILITLTKKYAKLDRQNKEFVPPKGSDISVENMRKTWKGLVNQIGNQGLYCRPKNSQVKHIYFYLVGLNKQMVMTLYYPEVPDVEFHGPTEVLKAVYQKHGINSTNIKGWDNCEIFIQNEQGQYGWKKFGDIIQSPYRNLKRSKGANQSQVAPVPTSYVGSPAVQSKSSFTNHKKSKVVPPTLDTVPIGTSQKHSSKGQPHLRQDKIPPDVHQAMHSSSSASSKKRKAEKSDPIISPGSSQSESESPEESNHNRKQHVASSPFVSKSSAKSKTTNGNRHSIPPGIRHSPAPKKKHSDHKGPNNNKSKSTTLNFERDIEEADQSTSNAPSVQHGNSSHGKPPVAGCNISSEDLRLMKLGDLTLDQVNYLRVKMTSLVVSSDPKTLQHILKCFADHVSFSGSSNNSNTPSSGKRRSSGSKKAKNNMQPTLSNTESVKPPVTEVSKTNVLVDSETKTTVGSADQTLADKSKSVSVQPQHAATSEDKIGNADKVGSCNKVGVPDKSAFLETDDNFTESTMLEEGEDENNLSEKQQPDIVKNGKATSVHEKQDGKNDTVMPHTVEPLAVDPKTLIDMQGSRSSGDNAKQMMSIANEKTHEVVHSGSDSTRYKVSEDSVSQELIESEVLLI